MDKENVIQIIVRCAVFAVCITYISYAYNIMYTHTREILPLATTWVNLVGILLSEISLTEKNKYHMLLHVKSKKVELTKAECRTVVASDSEVRDKGRCWSGVHTLS